MSILDQFDLTDPDSAPRMLEVIREQQAKRKQALDAVREVIPEHMPLIYAAMNASDDGERVSAARTTLMAFTKAGRREAFNAQIAWKQEESAHYWFIR